MRSILAISLLVLAVSNFLGAQNSNLNSFEIQPYFQKEIPVIYRVKVMHNALLFKSCDKELIYDIEIRYKEQIKNVNIYQLRFINFDSNLCLIGLDRHKLEISVDRNGNFIAINNWDKIQDDLVEFTRFQTQNDLSNSIKILVDHLFFLYGKKISFTEELHYLSFIPFYLDKTYFIDSEARINAFKSEQKFLNIYVDEKVSFGSDLDELLIQNVISTRNIILDEDENLFLSSTSTTTFVFNSKRYSFIRNVELMK